VHNSGHWTIEGAVTSQFENHLRAVLGWPIGDTRASATSAMVNCIGAMPERDAVLAIPGAHLHDYGKAPRPERKLGHVTLTSLPHDAPGELDARVGQVRSLLA
jgi:5-(carboxyamino)imidazole ribonucleotide synthase